MLVNESFSLVNPAKARFRVLSDTKIAVTVPALRVGRHYWVKVVSPASTSASGYSSPFSVVRPRLLKATFGAFAIRPAIVTPSRDGTFNIGQQGERIHWRVWSATKAYGVGTVWIDDDIPNAALGTFHGYRGSVTAFRVRNGRFTRMTVRWNQSGRTHREPLKLGHTNDAYLGSGWFWQ